MNGHWKTECTEAGRSTCRDWPAGRRGVLLVGHWTCLVDWQGLRGVKDFERRALWISRTEDVNNCGRRQDRKDYNDGWWYTCATSAQGGLGVEGSLARVRPGLGNKGAS